MRRYCRRVRARRWLLRGCWHYGNRSLDGQSGFCRFCGSGRGDDGYFGFDDLDIRRFGADFRRRFDG
jgi:hypothetical protein